jgi:hypothetical protein
MNSKKLYEHDEHDGEAYHDNTVSAGQLKHLIHLMDESDVTEVEVKRPQDGLRLVLRKVRQSTKLLPLLLIQNRLSLLHS